MKRFVPELGRPARLATPDASAAWLSAMRGGDLASAWRIGDRVLAERVAAGPSWHLPRHEQWLWDGRPLTGRTVLVRCYHGLGDTLQFARFLPRVQQLAARTVVWAQPPLLPLLSLLVSPRPVDLLPLHDGTPDVPYEIEVDIEIMELAQALRVSLDTLAVDVPYFEVPPAGRLSERFSVGLVAQAGDWDTRRSVPNELLARLARRAPQAELFNLQLGTPLPGLRDASTADMVQLAATVRALDLVITVDTMMAHLAGALGVPTWTLLPSEADWRWMGESRTDSPWYPSMRLFRQSQAGDWASVVERVAAALPCAG